MKKLSLPFLVLLCLNTIQAQQHEEMSNLRMEPRANVVSYDEENDIEHLRYGDASSLLFLADDWTVSMDSGRYVMTSDYEFPRSWKAYRIFFRMQAPSGYGLWMGDKLVGISHDCSAVTEFDISDLIRYGKTMPLTVRYVGSDDGTLLDPHGVSYQPQCTLLFKPMLNVQDYTIVAEYSPSSQSGSYIVEADLFNVKAKGKCYLEVELWDSKGHQVDKLGKWCFFDSRNLTTQTISSTLSNILPWNAEVPRLYTAVIRLYDDKMALQDLVGTRFGFRTISCQNALTVNGKAINLKGVILQLKDNLSSPEVLKRLRNQMVLMKCNNVNAIRITGGNPQPRLLELCDELGFYVVCDANLFPSSTMGHAVATDNEYSDLFADRVRALYGQYKNHPSVIAWSLGDSPDNGVCMQTAYRELKRLDRSRAVVYTAAQYSDNTDIIAPLECNVDFLNQYLAKKQSRPLMMLSYGDVWDNSFGGLTPLWDKVIDHADIQGGFLQMRDWQTFLSLPYLAECKHLYRPFDIRITSTSADAAEFDVTNLCDFRPLADFSLDYVIGTNHNSNIVAGDVALSLKPGESKSIKLKVPKLSLQADEEVSIIFTLRQRGNTNTVPRNTVLCTQQFQLPSTPASAQPFAAQGDNLKIETDTLHGVHIYNDVVSLIFNDSLGLLTSLSYKGHQLITQPLRLNFMRPPSANDAVDPNGVRQWMRYGLGHMDCEVVAANCHRVDGGTVGIDVMFRYSSAKHGDLFDVRQTFVVYPTGDILINNNITLSEQINFVAKVGVQMGLDKQLDTAEWFGRNIESYPDRHDAGLIAQQSRPIASLFHQYQGGVQHAGNYTDTRWAAFRNAEVGLYVDIPDTLCNFSIYPFDDTQMFGCREEVGWPGVHEQDFWTLNVDSRVMGVGCMLGGIPTPETALLKAHKYQFTIHLRPFDCATSHAQDFRAIAYPKVVSSVIEPPVISKSRERFDAPMSVAITSATPKVEIRYTLDGSIPTEKSQLYTKPFAIQNSVLVKARAFKKGEPPSFVATQQFTFDYVLSTTFAHKPNTPYNKNASKALYDGELGDVNDLSHGWLGFSGHPMQVDLELAKSIHVSQVVLRFAHVPDAWVFAPAQVEVQTSTDGKVFSAPIPATITYDAAAETMNTTQLQVITIPADREDVRFVRVIARPISHIPQWHRAKGLNPWIMVDEIEIKESLTQ